MANNSDLGNTIQSLTITDYINAVQNLYNNKANAAKYDIKVADDDYQVCSPKTQQILISVPAQDIIPFKTAAISMLAINLLHEYEPDHVAIYGIGKQAQAHIQALLALYPNIIIDVIAKNPSKSLKFVQSYADRRVRCTRIVFPEVDVVITATNSKRSVYSLQAETERLVIGIGAQDTDHIEIGRNTIQKSTIYTDDINSAQTRAGDLIKAETNWADVIDINADDLQISHDTPKIFKNMGASIWDQAIAELLVNKFN